MLKLVASFVFFFGVKSWCAPIPLSPTSIFFSSHKEIYRSALGFSIHAGDSQWQRIAPPKHNRYIKAIFRAPGVDSNVRAALTLRTDLIDKSLTLDSYSKKWLKDYPRLGFQVLTAKKVRVGERIGFLMDLVSKDSEKQIRQVVFADNGTAVTLTCRDDAKDFQTTLKSCNEIIRTFTW